MSRTSELSQILDEMICCGEGMVKAANEIKSIFSEDTAEKEYTFEDVRKAFAQKSHEGHTDDVRAIIEKFGAEKLSNISKEFYPALMKELEEIQ